MDQLRKELKEQFEFVGSEQISGYTALKIAMQCIDDVIYCKCGEKEVLMLPHSNTPYCAECGKNIKQI